MDLDQPAKYEYKIEVLADIPTGSKPGQVGFELTPDLYFTGPNAMTLDHESNIFINDQINKRIEEFDKNGKFKSIVFKWPSDYHADWIAVDSKGSLFVNVDKPKMPNSVEVWEVRAEKIQQKFPGWSISPSTVIGVSTFTASSTPFVMANITALTLNQATVALEIDGTQVSSQTISLLGGTQYPTWTVSGYAASALADGAHTASLTATTNNAASMQNFIDTGTITFVLDSSCSSNSSNDSLGNPQTSPIPQTTCFNPVATANGSSGVSALWVTGPGGIVLSTVTFAPQSSAIYSSFCGDINGAGTYNLCSETGAGNSCCGSITISSAAYQVSLSATGPGGTVNDTQPAVPASICAETAVSIDVYGTDVMEGQCCLFPRVSGSAPFACFALQKENAIDKNESWG